MGFNEIKIKLASMIRSSYALRFMLKPVMDLRNQLELIQYHRTADASYLRKYKGRFKGKRCFIIGNGPSLTGEDLDMLKDEICFGCNRIYNIFEDTAWRPRFYMCVDKITLMEEIENIKKLEGPVKFISFRAKKYGREKKDRLHYVVLFNRFFVDHTKMMLSRISEDVSEYLSYSNSVVINQIELAVYMGFKEIYLLGVDHNYPIMIDKDGNKTVDNSIKSHFKNGGSKETSLHYLYVDAATNDYSVCEKYARSHGIDIFNATRGGKLEVFRRVSLEEAVGR